ncbi:response regulator [Cohnella sp. 56]|uniref:response regulator n=1 Tax=Cohnella sp. 56 TaxID=3113722 RepID=UPI0030E77D72
MYKLLIVDDEEYIVRSLAETVAWDAAEISQVYTAFSGDEALRILEKQPIDLVISDIRMPGMSGLELIERAGRQWPKIKFLILTGHADFEYAQQAIKNKANDFLLKPLHDETLLQSVKQTTAQIKREWEEISSYRRANATLRENLPYLQQLLLSQLINGKKFSNPYLVQHLETLNIPIAPGTEFQTLLVRRDDYGSADDFNAYSLLEFAIGNIAEEMLSPEHRLWKCTDVHDYIVFAIWPQDPKEAAETWSRKLELIAQQFQENCKTYLKFKVSVVLGPRGVFPAEIPDVYQQCLAAIRERIGGLEEMFIVVDDADPQTQVDYLSRMYEPPALVHLLEAGNWDGSADKINDILAQLEDNWAHSEEHLLEAAHAFSAAFAYIFHKHGYLLSVMLGQDYSLFANQQQLRTIQQLKDWTSRLLDLLRKETDQKRKNTHSALVHKIHDYIKGNLAEASLQTIADQVYLNPVYLSRVYKEETGEGISEYVSRLKMDTAVHLLRNSHKKIYEIAEEVGYQNVPHFIKIFKRQYGITPQDFREK